MSVSTQVRNRNKKPVLRIIRITAIVLAVLVVAGIVAAGTYIFDVKSKLPDIRDPKVFGMTQASRIYASDGKTILAELQLENREPVASLDEISPYVIKATVATEDARFYEHKGVDWLGVFRAAFVIASGGETQGGSTITMQLVRNTILSTEAQNRSLDRKIAEVFLASEFEQMYSKDEILLMYLNTINYGDGYYGIQAASKHYFSKLPKDLDLNESATISGIPQSPTYLAPTQNEEACKQRRNLVLGRMYDDHIITKNEYDITTQSEISLNVTYRDLASMYKYPYFTTYVRDIIMNKYSKQEVFQGGFQIYTTLDVKDQEATELGCKKSNQQLEKDAESVAVTMDQSTGYVTSMVGGKNYNNNQYNIATGSGRPTGSSFKAFTLVAAIEAGLDPFSETVNCSSPMTYGDITVKNINDINYGTMTIADALAQSSNTGFVRLQQKIGTDNLIKTAKKLGIRNSELPNIATLTLGSANINPLDMATAFSTIANGGTYHEPVAITKIVTSQDEEIFNYDPDSKDNKGERVIDEKTAQTAIKAMKTVFTKGTAASAQLNNGQEVAGKTGTSDDFRDHTLIGFTPKLCCSTWIGKRNYQPTSSSVSCNSLWKTIMDSATKDDKQTYFDKSKTDDDDYDSYNYNYSKKYKNNNYNYNNNSQNSNRSRTSQQSWIPPNVFNIRKWNGNFFNFYTLS